MCSEGTSEQTPERPPEQAVEPADRCPQKDHIRLIPGMGFLPTTSSASQGEPKEDRHEMPHQTPGPRVFLELEAEGVLCT